MLKAVIPVPDTNPILLTNQHLQPECENSETTKILEVINKLPQQDKANLSDDQWSLTFNHLKSTQKISIANGKATIEELNKTPQLYDSLPNTLLGKGVFGEVHKGFLQNKHEQRKVAIKIYYPTFILTTNFDLEINALFTLKNQDYIVQIIFALKGEPSINNYIVMECGDIDLERYIKFIKKHPETDINTKQLAKIGHDIFSGTLACLENDIFNLDIKKNNYVIFFNQNVIKMIDFSYLKPEYSKENAETKIIKQTAQCFTYCILDQPFPNDIATEKRLQDILSKSSFSCISHKDKDYFSQQILPLVDNNPLLLKLAQGIFSNKDYLLDIHKTITDIKNEIELQPLTDIRHMLQV